MRIRRSATSCSLALLVLAAGAVVPSRGSVAGKDVFARYVEATEATSAGEDTGDRVLIRIGGRTFWDVAMQARATRGLYVVAIKNRTVLLSEHYDTFSVPGASEGFAQDIEKLRVGTFVVVATKDKPSRFMDDRGQAALRSIGAEKGLLGADSRISYICIGAKGLAPGRVIEHIDRRLLHHKGQNVDQPIDFVFRKEPDPKVSTKPGVHFGLMVGDTEVVYYIPKYFDPATARYLFGIHGAGGSGGAHARISQFCRFADLENLVILAPRFDCIFNFPEDQRSDKNGKPKPNAIEDLFLYRHQQLLNYRNEHRTDLKLIEIFEFFNRKLMKRDKFILYGHSGGGQFAHRFAIFHPELIDKCAASSAGTYTFPNRDKAYPYGLDMSRLERDYGAQINKEGLALTEAELDRKLERLFDLEMYVIVGELDTDEEVEKNNDFWQGRGHYMRGVNFHKAMQEEDKRLKGKGVRDSAKPFRMKLHVMKGIGHDSNMAARVAGGLLFGGTGATTKSTVLRVAYRRRAIDTSGHRHLFRTLKRPRFYKDYADFGDPYGSYLRTELKPDYDLGGCTELTIRVRVRMKPNPKRHYSARIIQTSDSQWGGSVICVLHTNRIGAWIETTTSRGTVVGRLRMGRSPTLLSKGRVDDGKWHEVVLTYTGQEAQLYIDGDLHARSDWDGRLWNVDHINIGYVQSNGFHFDGHIGEIEISGTRYEP